MGAPSRRGATLRVFPKEKLSRCIAMSCGQFRFPDRRSRKPADGRYLLADQGKAMPLRNASCALRPSWQRRHDAACSPAARAPPRNQRALIMYLRCCGQPSSGSSRDDRHGFEPCRPAEGRVTISWSSKAQRTTRRYRPCWLRGVALAGEGARFSAGCGLFLMARRGNQKPLTEPERQMNGAH